jgi:hypothetical protein
MHFEQLSAACGHKYWVEECARAGSGANADVRVVVDVERLGQREDALH